MKTMKTLAASTVAAMVLATLTGCAGMTQREKNVAVGAGGAREEAQRVGAQRVDEVAGEAGAGAGRGGRHEVMLGRERGMTNDQAPMTNQ